MAAKYYWRRKTDPSNLLGPATVDQIHHGLSGAIAPPDVEILAAAGQSYGQLVAAADWAPLPAAAAPAFAPPPASVSPPPPVTLTTAQGLDGFRVARTLEVITAECVFGMNVFRDFFASVSDIFGGRSTATQNVLRDARVRCLDELRAEARRLGANAVIAVDLDYSEISGQGKSMLFLVASGTAVVVEPSNTPAPAPPQHAAPAIPEQPG